MGMHKKQVETITSALKMQKLEYKVFVTHANRKGRTILSVKAYGVPEALVKAQMQVFDRDPATKWEVFNEFVTTRLHFEGGQ